MQIEAKVIADSISEAGVRLTTLQLVYPRFIHAEFMTHRVFSRNASSSRAIPVAKMIEQVRNSPAMPIHWGANKSGMQAGEELTGVELDIVKGEWFAAARAAADFAEAMAEQGIHKQVANRILEPFQWMHVIVTATEWSNFFALRDHPAAEPNIQVLAREMKAAMDASTPVLLRAGEWHLPYVSPEEMGAFGPIQTYLRGGKGELGVWNEEMKWELARKLSAARCARVSYLNHDGTAPDIEKDLELYGQLVVRPFTDKRGNVLTEDDPIHASPIEHQATPLPKQWANVFSGNFRGWQQFRKLVEAQPN